MIQTPQGHKQWKEYGVENSEFCAWNSGTRKCSQISLEGSQGTKVEAPGTNHAQ